MSARLRRRSMIEEAAADEGPFVSFTDLTIGIIFLFLILVAALMLMHQQAVLKWAEEARAYEHRIQVLQDKLDAIARLDAEHPPFRLALVYNSYQRSTDSPDWIFSRTVQVFRAPNGLCMENLLLRNNLSLAWMPPVKTETIPAPSQQDAVRMGTPCKLSAQGEQWNSDAETGSMKRVSPNLYSGSSVLHKKDGQVTIQIEYRILGVYDEYYRQGAQVAQTPRTSNRM
jgi:hypothetical protein